MIDELLEALVDGVLGGGRALQRVRGDGAEEQAVGLAVAAERRERRRGRCGRNLHHFAGPSPRSGSGSTSRDDAADDDRHLLDLTSWVGHIDGDVALALAVAGIGQRAAAGNAARVVISLNAISTALAPAWPYSPAGPVSSRTTPTVTCSRRLARSRPPPCGRRGGHRESVFSSCSLSTLFGGSGWRPAGSALCRRAKRGLLQMQPGDAAGADGAGANRAHSTGAGRATAAPQALHRCQQDRMDQRPRERRCWMEDPNVGAS